MTSRLPLVGSMLMGEGPQSAAMGFTGIKSYIKPYKMIEINPQCFSRVKERMMGGIAWWGCEVESCGGILRWNFVGKSCGGIVRWSGEVGF